MDKFDALKNHDFNVNNYVRSFVFDKNFEDLIKSSKELNMGKIKKKSGIRKMIYRQ